MKMGGDYSLYLCWTSFVVAYLCVWLIYRAECKSWGGIGLGTSIAAMTVVYNLLNPMFFLINPLLALLYAEYIGLDQPPSVLLPNILNTTIFLSALYIGIRRFRPRRKQVMDGVPSRRLPLSSATNILGVFAILAVAGGLMYVSRNVIAFGSWNGSFSADYAKDSARPQVLFFSAFGNIWTWAIQALSFVCLWQTSARAWPKVFALCPLFIGLSFTLVEGDRVMLGSAVLTLAAWFGFRRRLRFKNVVIALFLATLMALSANARYHKGEEDLTERMYDLVRPEYFRPFWSSDAYGPATMATLTCSRFSDPTKLSFGSGYGNSLLSMVPKVLWPTRPESTAIEFARWYAAMRGEQYYEGSGLAFNGLAEVFMNFWYPGTLFAGILFAILACWFNNKCSRKDTLSGRALFAMIAPLVAWHIVRSSLMLFLSPFMLVTFAFSRWLLRQSRPKCPSMLRSGSLSLIRTRPRPQIGNAAQPVMGD